MSEPSALEKRWLALPAELRTAVTTALSLGGKIGAVARQHDLPVSTVAFASTRLIRFPRASGLREDDGAVMGAETAATPQRWQPRAKPNTNPRYQTIRDANEARRLRVEALLKGSDIQLSNVALPPEPAPEFKLREEPIRFNGRRRSKPLDTDIEYPRPFEPDTGEDDPS